MNRNKNVRVSHTSCPFQKGLANSKPFSELLSNEFDFKACLIWTVIAVVVVIGLIRLIKCGLDRSERRSERFRITQQEKVMKDIDDYFSRANTDTA